MKNLIALVTVLFLGFLIISHLEANSDIPAFGEANVEDRDSDSYINKDVLGDNGEVIYGESEDLETGSANIVTSIVANYRSFDTLGEVTVLFISALGIALVLNYKKSERMDLNFHPNFMLRIGSRALFGIIIMTGIYISIHGHLTPGGGFPGGSMIAASILLLYISDDHFKARVKGFKVLESIMGVAYVTIGLVGLFVADYFLKNFLDTGIVGDLLSAGIIPIVYVIIGLKVGSEISNIIDNFLSEEAN